MRLRDGIDLTGVVAGRTVPPLPVNYWMLKYFDDEAATLRAVILKQWSLHELPPYLARAVEFHRERPTWSWIVSFELLRFDATKVWWSPSARGRVSMAKEDR